MASYTPLEFLVGDRAPDDARRLRLEGYVLEPSGPAAGIIIFSPGFTEPAGHCRGLLDPLADGFRVVAYSNRGHGSSEGVLSPAAAVRDLETVIGHPAVGGRPVLLGHSFGGYATGCASSRAAGCYWIAPFLSPSFAGPFQRAGLWLLQHMGLLVGLADRLVDRSGICRSYGILADRPLAAARGLAAVRPPQVGVPHAYVVPGRDEVLPPGPVARELAVRYPAAEDHSAVARELGHCLNRGFRDFRPFCRPEPGKDTAAIAERIARFSTKCLKSP
jgi:pimeloyl-ACP methyl ester carboxylesterase